MTLCGKCPLCCVADIITGSNREQGQSGVGDVAPPNTRTHCCSSQVSECIGSNLLTHFFFFSPKSSQTSPAPFTTPSPELDMHPGKRALHSSLSLPEMLSLLSPQTHTHFCHTCCRSPHLPTCNLCTHS